MNSAVSSLLSFAFLGYVVVSFKITTPIPAKFDIYEYTQKVDHFSYTNNDTFQQRLIISTQHWCQEGCPIFFYTGNEGDIFMFANNTGFMWENAPRFRAMVVFAEHRYYGKSNPYGMVAKKGADLKKLGFLSAEQALADYAQIIQDIKLNYEGAKNSPVIVFGGSYGGMLAAWFRMKYPHLAEGALAASAPILQFPGMYNCTEFYRIITNDFAKYSPNCSQTIRKSWDAIQRVTRKSDGLRWLSKTFKLCKTMSKSDLDTFINWLNNTYQNLAMIDYPNPSSFLAPLPAYPIREVCEHLTNPSKSDKSLLRDLADAISVYTNYTETTVCNNIFEDSSGLGEDAWDFQSCTEMVMPVCSDGVHDMFDPQPWDLKVYQETCEKNWDVRPEPKKIEMMFGGKDITSYSNIIFSNGLRDPWSAGGVMHNVSDSLIAIVIPNACHHEDLRPSGPNDPPALLEARQQEIRIIKRWLDEYYESIQEYPESWKRMLEL